MRENVENTNNEQQIKINQVRNTDRVFPLQDYLNKQESLFNNVQEIKESVNFLNKTFSQVAVSVKSIQDNINNLNISREIINPQKITEVFNSLNTETIIKQVKERNDRQINEYLERSGINFETILERQIEDIDNQVNKLKEKYERVHKPFLMSFLENFFSNILKTPIKMYNEQRIKERIQRQIDELKDIKNEVEEQLKQEIGHENGRNVRENNQFQEIDRIDITEQEQNKQIGVLNIDNENKLFDFLNKYDTYLKEIHESLTGISGIKKKEFDIQQEELMDIKSERERQNERELEEQRQPTFLQRFLGNLFGGITGYPVQRMGLPRTRGIGGFINPRMLTGLGFQQLEGYDIFRQMNEWRDEEGNLDMLGMVMGSLQGTREGGWINQLQQGGKWQQLGFTLGGPLGQLIGGGQGQVIGQIGQERLRNFQDSLVQFFTGIRVTEEEIEERINEVQNDPKYRDLTPEQLREVVKKQIQMEKHPIIYRLQNVQKGVGRVIQGPFIGFKNILTEGVLYSEEEVEKRYLELKQEHPELSEDELKRMQEEQLRRERMGIVLYGIQKFTEGFKSYLTKQFGGIQSFTKTIFGKIKNFFVSSDEITEEELNQKIQELENDPQYKDLSEEELRQVQEELLREEKMSPFKKMLKKTFGGIKSFFGGIFGQTKTFIDSISPLSEEEINEKIEELKQNPDYQNLSDEQLRNLQMGILNQEKKDIFTNMIKNSIGKMKTFFGNIFSGIGNFINNIIPVSQEDIDEKVNELREEYPEKSEEELKQMQEEILKEERKNKFKNMISNTVNNVKKFFGNLFTGIKGLFGFGKKTQDEQLNTKIEELRSEYPELSDEELRQMQLQDLENKKLSLETIGLNITNLVGKGLKFLFSGVRSFFDNQKQKLENQLNERINELKSQPEYQGLSDEELRLVQLEQLKQEWQQNHPILNMTKKQFGWFNNTIKNIFSWFKGEKKKLESEIQKEYNLIINNVQRHNRELQEESLTEYWKEQIGGGFFGQKNLRIKEMWDKVKEMNDEMVEELFGITKEQFKQLYDISGLDKKIDVDELQRLIKQGKMSIEDQYKFVNKLSTMKETLESSPELMEKIFGTTNVEEVLKRLKIDDISKIYEKKKEILDRMYQQQLQKYENNKRLLEQQIDKLIDLNFEDLKGIDKEVLSLVYYSFPDYQKKWINEGISQERVDILKQNLEKLKEMKFFQEGGFTGFGRDNDIVGFVHQNEYVLPKELITQYPEMITTIEKLRTDMITSDRFEREMNDLWNRRIEESDITQTNNITVNNTFEMIDDFEQIRGTIENTQIRTEDMLKSINDVLNEINEKSDNISKLENVQNVLVGVVEQLKQISIDVVNNNINTQNTQLIQNSVNNIMSGNKPKVSPQIGHNVQLNRVGGGL